MTEDLGRLGLVIEGAGARREVQLTKDELIKLVNGGNEAAAVLKKIGDPSTQQGIKSTADGVKRTADELRRIAEAQASLIRRLDPFQAAGGSRLGTPFKHFAAEINEADVKAQKLKASLDQLAASRQRMQANAMASQISQLDPFQAGATIGAVDNAARSATLNVNKLRQGFTSLAIAATGVPGPVGQMASSLAPLAMGGGIAVGVIAGIAAIAFAFDKFTEKSRKAAADWQKDLDVLRQLKREQDLGPTGDVGRITPQARQRLASIGPELREVNRRIEGPGSIFESQYSLGTLRDRRTALVREASELQRLIGAGEKEVTRIVKEEADERLKKWQEEHDKRVKLTRDIYGQPFTTGDIADNIARAMARMDDQRNQFKDFERGAGVGAGRVGFTVPEFEFDKDFLFQLNLQIDKSVDWLKKLADAAKDAADAQKENAAQARNAARSVAQYALGQAVSRFSPTSGASVFAQTGAGVVAGIGGGPLGMLAGGIIGLAGGLFGLSDAAKQQKRAMQREQQEREKLVETLQRENIVRNAPSGFFVERYYRPTGPSNPPGLPPINRPPLNSVAGSGATSVVYDLRGATFSLSGNGGRELLRDFVRQLRELAAATGGPNMPLADALEMI